jgi:tetratricopeptide (TPR) repeat protein
MKKILLPVLICISSFGYSQTAEEYYYRGKAKYPLKDYRGAIQDYSKAIELDPEYAHAYYYRGNAKVNLKDYRGAIQDYSKAIELDPKMQLLITIEVLLKLI